MGIDRRTALGLGVKALATGVAGAAGGWAYTAMASDRLTGLTASGPPLTPSAPSAADVWTDVRTSVRTGVLTADGPDRYDVRTARTETAVAAPPSNAGRNLRVALSRDAEVPSADHRACATFLARDRDQQPGLALRIRSDGARTQAITVTKNVWGGMYWRFNVHVMDSAAPEPFRQLASFDLSSTFRTADGRPRPYPWRMCAEIRGATVRFVVWTPWDAPPEWGDPAHGGQVTLPVGWGAPGRPGLYAAHLPPGRTLAYRAVATQAL